MKNVGLKNFGNFKILKEKTTIIVYTDFICHISVPSEGLKCYSAARLWQHAGPGRGKKVKTIG